MGVPVGERVSLVLQHVPGSVSVFRSVLLGGVEGWVWRPNGSWVLLIGLIGVDWMAGRRGDVRVFFPGHFGGAAAGVEGDVEAVFVFHCDR